MMGPLPESQRPSSNEQEPDSEPLSPASRPDDGSRARKRAFPVEGAFDDVVQRTISVEIFDRQTSALLERLQSVARRYPAEEPLSEETVRALLDVVIEDMLADYPAAKSSAIVNSSIERIVDSFLSSPASARRLERFWAELQRSVR